MSNKRQVNELEDELDLIPERSFITNRKTQLVLNVVLIIVIAILVVLIYKKEDEIERNRELISYRVPSQEIEPKIHPLSTTMEQQYDTHTISTISIDKMTKSSINFVSPEDWFAINPICNTTMELAHPTENIVIAHTATSECFSPAACMNRVRFIQKTNHEEKLCDIKYNFLVGGDGIVYIGRGWDKQAAHSKNQNANRLRIAFIGHFEYKTPNRFQIDVAQRLIEFGVQIQKLDANYIVYPEKYFANTESPGKEVVRIIKKWPHYCNP